MKRCICLYLDVHKNLKEIFGCILVSIRNEKEIFVCVLVYIRNEKEIFVCILVSQLDYSS